MDREQVADADQHSDPCQQGAPFQQDEAQAIQPKPGSADKVAKQDDYPRADGDNGIGDR